jgi:NAD(P)-dependent dehydrogenase (short-subunit alcohol dehydrogenase family)
MVALAIETFGRLDILVNNAGILRDRLFANMTEDDWDAVIRVHLKGHAAPARHAMEYWRNESKAGRSVAASIVHTTSLAGLVGSFGQANYASAKLAVVGLSRTLALEGTKYGVRSNAVSPSARTRIETSLKPPTDGSFDVFSPDNVAPLICWLALEDCPATGQVFQVYGDRIEVIAPSTIEVDLRTNGRWHLEDIENQLNDRLPKLPKLGDFVDGLPL